MQETMQAVVKAHPAPGAEIREVKVPAFGPSDVLNLNCAVCKTVVYATPSLLRSRIGAVRNTVEIGHQIRGGSRQAGNAKRTQVLQPPP